MLKHGYSSAKHYILFALQEITGGLSNKLIACRLKDDEKDHDAVLLKIYGNESAFNADREKEILVMRAIHHIGCGEPLYCTFANGMAYSYNPGSVLDQASVTDQNIARLVTLRYQMFILVLISHSPLPKGHSGGTSLSEVDRDDVKVLRECQWHLSSLLLCVLFIQLWITNVMSYGIISYVCIDIPITFR